MGGSRSGGEDRPGLRETRCTRVVIHGRVQGVAFRATTCREASRRGLRGWVRNLPDGSVEALFEGEPADVEALVRWCRTGPAWARVDRVETHPEPIGNHRGFEIR